MRHSQWLAYVFGVVLVGCYSAHGRLDAGNPPPDTSLPDALVTPPPDAPPPDTRPLDTGDAGADTSVVDAPEDAGPPTPRECTRSRPVDLLFVVDDSGSAQDYRFAVQEALYIAVQSLLNPPDRDGDGVEDWPRARDLHLGVTTSSIDGGGVCPGAPDGALSRGEASVDPTCEGPFPNFISHSGSGDDAESVARDFACMVGGVAPGCMIEQPLEAALKALLPSDTSVEFIAGPARGDTENAGFLREGSLLVLVFVTDEDDCSIQDPARLRPVDAGTGPVPPGYDAGPPRIDICDDVEALFPLTRYVEALRTIRAPRDLLFGVISGWPELFSMGDVLSVLEDSSGGCVDETGWTAAPTRLVELGSNFSRDFAGSICKVPDRRISERLARHVAETACRPD